MADVDNYVKRFETECGDVVNRFATENELKEITKKLELLKRRTNNERSNNKTK